MRVGAVTRLCGKNDKGVRLAATDVESRERDRCRERMKMDRQIEREKE